MDKRRDRPGSSADLDEMPERHDSAEAQETADDQPLTEAPAASTDGNADARSRLGRDDRFGYTRVRGAISREQVGAATPDEKPPIDRTVVRPALKRPVMDAKASPEEDASDHTVIRPALEDPGLEDAHDDGGVDTGTVIRPARPGMARDEAPAAAPGPEVPVADGSDQPEDFDENFDGNFDEDLDETIARFAPPEADGKRKPTGFDETAEQSSPYEIKELIAEGGMAEVYYGVDAALGDAPRAIKLVKHKFLQGDLGAEFIRRFRAEALTIEKLDHDNIVRIYGLTTINTRPAIVMDYLDGGNLADRIKRGPVPVEETLSIMIRMADALGYAHGLADRVIHRDFKPANILFKRYAAREDKPVLSDFGIAKASAVGEDPENETRLGTVLGSGRYMAPEQARGKANEPSVDIFAFGVVLFECLTGRLPPDRVTDLHRSTAERDAEIRTLLKPLADARTKPLAKLIARCLEVDESARPSARECREELERLAQRGSGTAIRPWPVAVGVVCFTAIAAGGAWLTLSTADEADPDGVPSTVGAPTIEEDVLDTSALPEGATLFLDGVPHQGRLTRPLAASTLTITAPGYVGRTLDLEREEGPFPGDFRLRELREPEPAEFEALFGSQSRMNEALARIVGAASPFEASQLFDNPTLSTLAELLWGQEHDGAYYEERLARLYRLEAAGDVSAATALFADQRNKGEVAIREAARTYALAAALYLAHIRSGASTEPLPSPDDLLAYETLVRDAPFAP